MDNGTRRVVDEQCGKGCSRATDADPGVRGTTRARLRRRLRCRAALRQAMGQGARAIDGGGLRPAELRAGGSLPVRLEPRGRPAERGDGHREGRPCPALSQPHDVRAGLSARDAGDGVRRPRPSLRPVQRRLRARHLRQHEDRGGDNLRRQATPLQSPLPADVQPLPRRSGRLHTGIGLGEGASREPGWALIRERFFTPRLRFKNLDELNAWLLDKCIAYAKVHHHPELTEQTIWEVFEAERPKLVPYAGRFDGFHAVQASVSKTCLVRFDNNKYSVTASAVGRPVEVHAYADRIVIRQDGRIVGEHPRSFGRGDTLYDPWHYVPVLARKPGALRNGAPFKDWVLPAAMERVRRKLASADDGNRQMVDILSAVLTDGLPAVEAACAEAIAHGVHSADVVLNILARRRDPGPPATILTPAALMLRHTPIADCARYDNLRRTI